LLGRLFRGRDPVGELRLALKMTIGGTAAWWLAAKIGRFAPSSTASHHAAVPPIVIFRASRSSPDRKSVV